MAKSFSGRGSFGEEVQHAVEREEQLEHWKQQGQEKNRQEDIKKIDNIPEKAFVRVKSSPSVSLCIVNVYCSQPWMKIAVESNP